MKKPVFPLYRALSKLGVASRTQAQEMIANGEINVDGVVSRDPDHMVSLEKSVICHNGKKLLQASQTVILFYKPRDVITSRKDEQNRQTVYSFLPPELQSLHCVGRLDFATSGLLLLTNNTKLSSWLTDPVNGVARVYTVTVRGRMTEQDADKMRNGIVDDNETLQAGNVLVRKASGRESHLVCTLTEGKNREIRRLCKAVGHEVTRLKRVAFGGLTLGNLQPGGFCHLSEQELSDAFPGLLM
jgi:23S rRNA pseudouridine2605 synthase